MLNQKNDIKFGDMAVNLGLLKEKQLQDCLNLQKQWFFQGETFSLEQCLLRFQYLTPQQIAVIHQQLQKKEQTPSSSFKTFGRYQIILEIGRGSMGVVYKAYDPELKRIIAIKILQNKGHDDIERFLREAKATAKLKHPNIVEVYDIGCVEGQYFYAMDYIEGITLDELAKKRKLTVKQCLSIMIKISHGIAYAHQEGVVHRDLKPANIMIDKDGNPRVMDFGLAKILDEHDQLSKSGMIIGTLQYMSPEQAEGNVHLIGKHSDVYSLGAILYEILTGRPTFIGNSFAQVVDQILYKAPTPPSSIKKIITRELEYICLKALEKKIENRYPDAEAFVYDLCSFIEGKSIATKKVSIGVKQTFLQARFYKKNILITLILLTVFLAFSIYIVFGEKQQSEKVLQYVTSEFKKLKSYQEFFPQDPNEPYILSYSKANEIKENIRKYVALSNLLQEKVSLYQKDSFGNNAMLAIHEEIILTTILLNDYLTSTVYLKMVETLCNAEKFNLFREQILAKQQGMRDYFTARIELLMNQIKDKPFDNIPLYSHEIQKMPYEYSFSLLFSYMDSKELLQKFLAIHTVGRVNNNSFKFNNKNRIDYLLSQIQTIDMRRDLAETNELVKTLFLCCEDPRVVEELKNIIKQIEYRSVLWYEIIEKHQVLLPQKLGISEQESLDSLKENLCLFIQKEQNILKCTIDGDIRVERIPGNWKKVDVSYRVEDKSNMNIFKARTFIFEETLNEIHVHAMSPENNFLYYGERNERVAIETKLHKAIAEFYEGQKTQDKILYIEKSHRLSGKDIYKAYISYECTKTNNEKQQQQKWFYFEYIAGQYYIIGS